MERRAERGGWGVERGGLVGWEACRGAIYRGRARMAGGEEVGKGSAERPGKICASAEPFPGLLAAKC